MCVVARINLSRCISLNRPVCRSPVIARPCHRAQLQQVFAKNLRSAEKTLHFSKRLASYIEPTSPFEPIVLKFRDDTEATCDVLIGSDGIRSAVRRTMYSALADETQDAGRAEELRKMIYPEWTGMVVYRGLVPVELLDPDRVAKEMVHTSVVSPPLLEPHCESSVHFIHFQLVGKDRVGAEHP